MNCSLWKLGCRFSSHRGLQSPRFLKGVIGAPAHEAPPWDLTRNPNPGSGRTPPRCRGQACFPIKGSRPGLGDVKGKAVGETSVSGSVNPRVCGQGLRPGSLSRSLSLLWNQLDVPAPGTALSSLPSALYLSCRWSRRLWPLTGSGPGSGGRGGDGPRQRRGQLICPLSSCLSHSPPINSGKCAALSAGWSLQTAGVDCNDIRQYLSGAKT